MDFFIISLQGSYFVNDYYFTKSFDRAIDIDFEVVQNNYSERRILGIDNKIINRKKLYSYCDFIL